MQKLTPVLLAGVLGGCRLFEADSVEEHDPQQFPPPDYWVWPDGGTAVEDSGSLWAPDSGPIWWFPPPWADGGPCFDLSCLLSDASLPPLEAGFPVFGDAGGNDGGLPSFFGYTRCNLPSNDFDCDHAHCDAVADVTERPADILASRGFVWNDEAVVQILFPQDPFGLDITHSIALMFDKDNDPQTGGSDAGPAQGFEAAISITGGNVDFGPYPPFPYSISIDQDLHLLEVRVQLDTVSNDAHSFHYALLSSFGGSFGTNDASPEQPGTFFSADAEGFSADDLCDATRTSPSVAQQAACSFTLDSTFTAPGTHWDGIDADKPLSDILASRAFASGDDAVIQLFFATIPLSQEASRVVVFFDNDANPNDGEPSTNVGIDGWHYDSAIGVQVVYSGNDHNLLATQGTELLIDNEKYLLQLRLPLSEVSNDGVIRYAVASGGGELVSPADTQPNAGPSFLLGTTVSDANQLCLPHP